MMDSEDIAYIYSKSQNIPFSEALEKVKSVEDFDFEKFFSYSDEKQDLILDILIAICDEY